MIVVDVRPFRRIPAALHRHSVASMASKRRMTHRQAIWWAVRTVTYGVLLMVGCAAVYRPDPLWMSEVKPGPPLFIHFAPATDYDSIMHEVQRREIREGLKARGWPDCLATGKGCGEVAP